MKDNEPMRIWAVGSGLPAALFVSLWLPAGENYDEQFPPAIGQLSSARFFAAAPKSQLRLPLRHVMLEFEPRSDESKPAGRVVRRRACFAQTLCDSSDPSRVSIKDSEPV